MNEKSSLRKMMGYLVLGQLMVAVLTALIFLLAHSFDYTVITGVALGCGVSLAEYGILIYSVNRGVDRFLAERGIHEMSEEEATIFAEKHARNVQNSTKASYLLRNFLMLGVLLLAFLSEEFHVLATVVPLLTMRPMLMLLSLTVEKERKKGA